MKYQDIVYGEVDIIEPVILELINSPSLFRLKGIDQFGYRPSDYSGIPRSRFDHSVGVYLLLKKYKVPLAEQIAGLIHDVSHSAFSHCIDYALDAGSETLHSHQDNVFDQYVKNSEIPVILKKYGFDVNYILDDKNFPLKEKDLPDLCADRIDYSLRDAVIFSAIGRNEIEEILSNLVTENNDWIFKDYGLAKKYAELFLKINAKYYCDLASAIMLRSVGDYLRYALDKKYINENDLYTTDQEVLDKIKRFFNEDDKLKLLFDRMDRKVDSKNNPSEYDVKVSCKSRVVDPLFKARSRIKRLSEVDSEWKNTLAIESNPKEYFIKFSR